MQSPWPFHYLTLVRDVSADVDEMAAKEPKCWTTHVYAQREKVFAFNILMDICNLHEAVVPGRTDWIKPNGLKWNSALKGEINRGWLEMTCQNEPDGSGSCRLTPVIACAVSTRADAKDTIQGHCHAIISL